MIRRFLAVAVLAVAVSACQTPDPTPRYAEITFSHLAKIKLDVGAVDYVQAYTPPSKIPNVDHLFPLRPSAVARRWAEERLEAAGPISRVARVTLVDASVIGSALDTTQGIKGLFTVDQAARNPHRNRQQPGRCRGPDQRHRPALTDRAGEHHPE